MTLCNAKLTRTSGTSSPIVESSRRPPSRPSSASAKTRHAPGHGLSASRASAAPSPGRATTSIASLPTSRAARMRTSTPHLTITLWRSQYARHGRCEELTWREFVGKYVARPEIARTKTSVAGFSIATFHGNRRALANVECVYALGLDFDRGDTTIDQAARLWRGSMGVAYTTWSHEPTTPRLRGVIVLSRPVSADEYARIWTWAADRSAKAGHVVDSAARDASRFWFVPSHRPGAEFMFRELHGSPLDVEAVLRQHHSVLFQGGRPRAELESTTGLAQSIAATPALTGSSFSHACARVRRIARSPERCGDDRRRPLSETTTCTGRSNAPVSRTRRISRG